MKSNPFYALSASAMLLGCWLLSEALHLQAGQLRGLQILMLVLQLYEGLLVALGAFLVRSGRASRDGIVVLAIESVFLMDATLLTVECVATDATVGTVAAITNAALALAKLAWVRRAAPDLLSRRAAIVLGAHAGFVVALPVVAVQLTAARLLSPAVLYGMWWTTAILPVAQRLLRDATRGRYRESGWTHAAWTWTPCAMSVLHLWTVGYVHTLEFRAAFLSPLLLGLVLSTDRRQLWERLLLPAFATLVSTGSSVELQIHAVGIDFTLSPLRVTVFAAGLLWAYLAWRDHDRLLAALTMSGAAVGLVSPYAPQLARALIRHLSEALPRDAFGWGALAVAASFVLLAAGARRSLRGERSTPGNPGPKDGRRPGSERDPGSELA